MTAAAAPGRSVTVRARRRSTSTCGSGPVAHDGYHPLSTVFQAVGLYDDVTVEPPPTTGGITVTGPYADLVPVDGTNLAAARGRAPWPTRRRRPSRCTSPSTRASRSPAAWPAARPTRRPRWWPATAVGPAASPRERPGRARRRASAATCRSACTAARRSAPAAGTARPPCSAAARYHWVFALSDVGLSTPAVYAECDRLRGQAPVPEPAPSAPTDGGAALRRRRGARPGADQRPAGGGADPAARA